jgi:hypothetical protein
MFACKSASPERYEMTDSMDFSSVAEEDSIYDFSADTLSDANLRALEVRAIQKLQDVVDLIQILSNDSTEKTFRLQAKTMLLGNFESENDSVSLYIPDTNPLQLTVSQLADSLINKHYAPLKLKIRSPKIYQPLTPAKEACYNGTIYFLLEITQNHKSLYPKDMSAGIILKKTQKVFGDKTQDVWEVYLNKIEI